MKRTAIEGLCAVLMSGCFFNPVELTPQGSTEGLDGAESSSSEAGSAPTSGEPTSTGAVAECGDFKVEGDEQCDNGANNNGNGGLCKADCTLNKCGDDYLVPAVEGCDDGNLSDGDGCKADCTIEGCGDGEKTWLEECDDGNSDDTDACTNLCRLPICGDGIVNGQEKCDDPMGNSDMGACLSTCKTNICGDGFVHAGVEACDDGNAVDDDDCTSDCALASCGDGQIQDGEQCDDGANNGETKACLPTCIKASCGDGFALAGEEQCDDGNLGDGDGCSAMCTVEECGNGIQDLGEQCDEGVANGVSETSPCDAACKRRCGNGVLNVGEPCDDGNQFSGDSCSSECVRTGWRVFVTSQKYTGKLGGTSGANQKCKSAAQGAALTGPENYRAYVGVQDGLEAGENIKPMSPLDQLPYFRTDDVMISKDFFALTSNVMLTQPINRTQTKEIIMSDGPCAEGGNAVVWTGTANLGGADTNNHCVNWTVSSSLPKKTGRAGMADVVSKEWSSATCSPFCDTTARLYCFETKQQ